MNAKKDKLALIAFLLMLSGPTILILVSKLLSSSGDVPRYISLTISIVSFSCALASLIINIIIVVKYWETINVISRGLAIASFVMLNPLFLFAYGAICFIIGADLSGLPTM